MEKPTYKPRYDTGNIKSLDYVSYYSDAIVDNDDNKSEENTTKRKARVVGPLEIVRDM